MPCLAAVPEHKEPGAAAPNAAINGKSSHTQTGCSLLLQQLQEPPSHPRCPTAPGDQQEEEEKGSQGETLARRKEKKSSIERLK